MPENQIMVEKEQIQESEVTKRLENVDKCLSMIMHFEEIQLLAGVIREVIEEQDHTEKPQVEI